MNDFSRLDERFRISDDAWKKLPQYRDYGFAVFKLKAGELTVHPMAFSFPRRNPKACSFQPSTSTMAKCMRKRILIMSSIASRANTSHCRSGTGGSRPAMPDRFMKTSKARGLISPEQHCYQKKLHGLLPNRDTLVAIAA